MSACSTDNISVNVAKALLYHSQYLIACWVYAITLELALAAREACKLHSLRLPTTAIADHLKLKCTLHCDSLYCIKDACTWEILVWR